MRAAGRAGGPRRDRRGRGRVLALAAALAVLTGCGGDRDATRRACAAISAWTTASVRLSEVDEQDPAALRAGALEYERVVRRLHAAAPDGIRDDTEPLVQAVARWRGKLAELRYDVRHLDRSERIDVASAGQSFNHGGDDGESIGDFGEKRCGLLGGAFPVGEAEAVRFCLAYQRYSDVVSETRPSDRVRARAFAALVPVAPRFLAPTVRRVTAREEAVAAGRASREKDPALYLGWRVIDLFVGKVCAIRYYDD